MIKKVFYSIAVSLAIRLIAVWLLWNHWSFLTIVAYVIFEVFSLPVISNLTLSTAIIMFVVVPILMWLSISFGLYHYSIEIKRKIKN